MTLRSFISMISFDIELLHPHNLPIVSLCFRVGLHIVVVQDTLAEVAARPALIQTFIFNQRPCGSWAVERTVTMSRKIPC